MLDPNGRVIMVSGANRGIGIALDDVAQAVTNPDMLGGVLDYLLTDETLLLEFTADAGLAPEDPAKARQALPGYMPQM